MKTNVKVYTDGSAKAAIGQGGYSALMESGSHKQAVFGNAKNISNNYAELQAVVSALKTLTEPCKVEIVSDSNMVVDGCGKWMKKWKANGWLRDVANKELYQEIDQLQQIHDVRFTKVKAHRKGKLSPNEKCNAMADHLAGFAASLPY